jgi:RNA polymerase sigma-70 factor (ECF subfamily)
MNGTLMSQEEASLLRRFVRSGDADAFSEISRLYAGTVYGTCLRVTGNQEQAADAAQETFYHLLKNPGRITGSLGGWLHQMAVRRAIDLVRRDVTRRRHESAYAAVAEPVATDQWADVSPLVDEALSELKEDLRDILLRHYLQKQSTVQIAAAKGVSQPTVSRRIEQALEMLRGKLRAKGVLVSTTALVGLMPNAATSVPAVVLQKLGKMGLAASGSTASGAATTVFSGLEMRLAALAALAVLGVGGFLTYERNHAAQSSPAAAASAQPAMASDNVGITALPDNLPAPAPTAPPFVANVAAALPASMGAGRQAQTPTTSAAPLQADSESTWGEAVEGVQARLRARQTNWKEGTLGRLFVDVRNQGTRHLLVQANQVHGCELEVDGKWFRRAAYTREIRALPSPFPPGRQYDHIGILLDRHWDEAGEAQRRLGRLQFLRLTPGKHPVRVAVTATAGKTEPGKPVRTISNPVEIEIVSSAVAPAESP